MKIEEMPPGFDDPKELLKMSYAAALPSPDPSTQNGALIITADGHHFVSDCNRFPDHVECLPERLERPIKYQFIEHAERNAIFLCARHGITTQGATMICGWAACSNCARAIIQSGIGRLITHKQAHDRSPAFWKQEIEVAMIMLKEAGVQVKFYDGKVDAVTILHCGEAWCP